MTQTAIVLKYLSKHRKGLTALEALHKLGCFRLASRIHELKEMGCNIIDVYESNGRSRWKRYFLA